MKKRVRMNLSKKKRKKNFYTNVIQKKWSAMCSYLWFAKINSLSHPSINYSFFVLLSVFFWICFCHFFYNEMFAVPQLHTDRGLQPRMFAFLFLCVICVHWFSVFCVVFIVFASKSRRNRMEENEWKSSLIPKHVAWVHLFLFSNAYIQSDIILHWCCF